MIRVFSHVRRKVPISRILQFQYFSSKSSAVIELKNVSNRVHSIRNVGVVAHIDAGKTTTSEQMLYISGETKSIGRVDNGDTVMDFLPQERERGITISSAAISFPWNKHLINLIDTPGHVDFTVEVERSARVLDGAILVVDGVAGVQAQTQTVWKQVKKQNVSTIAFINKMDRDGASFERSLKSLETKLNVSLLPIQIPIGSEQGFYGVVDLCTMTKVTWGQSYENIATRTPPKPVIMELPNLKQIEEAGDDIVVSEKRFYKHAWSKRLEMIELLAEVDEIILEKYLSASSPSSSTVSTPANDVDHVDGDGFSSLEIKEAIRRCCVNGSLIPALCGASLKGKGVELLLNAITDFLPSPADRPSAMLVRKQPLKKSINSSNSHSNIHSHSSSIQATSKKKDKESNILSLPNASEQSSDDEFCGLAFKVVHDVNRGFLVFIRVYSGTLSSKQIVYNSTRGIKERVLQLVQIDAEDYVNIPDASVGDVVCLVGLKSTVTGDTLVSADKSPYEQYVLESVIIPEAVYSVTVEPEKSSQQTGLENALNILKIEDPSLQVESNAESGQILLKGLGELHIEIVCDKLKRQHNIMVYTGKSYVAYRESLKSDVKFEKQTYQYDKMVGGKRMFAGVTMSIQSSAQSSTTGSIDDDRSSSIMNPSSSTSSNNQPVVISIDKEVLKQLNGEEYTALSDSLQSSCSRGPYGYPITGVTVTIHSILKDSDTTSGAIRACIASTMDSCFRNDENHEFLEPIMSIEITGPTASVGYILSDLTVKRRADIIEVLSGDDDDDDAVNQNKGNKKNTSNTSTSTILAHVPLSTMLGYASTIRSLTQGEGRFSMEYLRHVPIDFDTAQSDMKS